MRQPLGPPVVSGSRQSRWCRQPAALPLRGLESVKTVQFPEARPPEQRAPSPIYQIRCHAIAVTLGSVADSTCRSAVDWCTCLICRSFCVRGFGTHKTRQKTVLLWPRAPPASRPALRKGRPERLGLRRADVQPDSLASAISVGGYGDYRGNRYDAATLTLLQGGGVEQ